MYKLLKSTVLTLCGVAFRLDYIYAELQTLRTRGSGQDIISVHRTGCRYSQPRKDAILITTSMSFITTYATNSFGTYTVVDVSALGNEYAVTGLQRGETYTALRVSTGTIAAFGVQR